MLVRPPGKQNIGPGRPPGGPWLSSAATPAACHPRAGPRRAASWGAEPEHSPAPGAGTVRCVFCAFSIFPATPDGVSSPFTDRETEARGSWEPAVPHSW